MTLLLAALALSLPARSVHAFAAAPSPALGGLEAEAAKNPAGESKPEDVKTDAGTSFTGEKPSPEAPVRLPPAQGGESFIFTGKSPVKGINIYTPAPDPNGTGQTEKPKPKDLISKKKVMGLAGLGAGALVGGILLGGLFGGILLALGGALLGAAAMLWMINRKAKKGRAG